MLEFGAPRFTDKYETTEHLWQECPRVEELQIQAKKSEANAFEAIYSRELLANLQSSKTVGIFHTNSEDSRKKRKAWQNARRLGFELADYEAVMVRSGVKGTQWENLMFFLDGGHEKLRLTFAPGVQAINLFKLEKKVPEMFLMGRTYQCPYFFYD